MKAFLIQLGVQFRGDMRDKGVLMVYYLVPLAFYLVMGSIMKALEMESGAPLTLSITVFAMSMSAYLGMPQSLVKAREQGVLEAYRAAGGEVTEVELEGVGHSPHLERPAEFRRALLERIGYIGRPADPAPPTEAIILSSSD